MSDAQQVIAEVLRVHRPCIDNEVSTEPFWCGDDDGCGTWDKLEHPRWRDHIAAEVDAALGGLTRAWAAVLGDGSYFGPYHESMSPDARVQAEADVAEYDETRLSSRWVSGWTPEETN